MVVLLLHDIISSRFGQQIGLSTEQGCSPSLTVLVGLILVIYSYGLYRMDSLVRFNEGEERGKEGGIIMVSSTIL